MAALISLMIGLRYEVGGDWRTYLEIFRTTGYADFADALTMSDPGYGLFNWLAQQFGLGMWAVNLACAVLFMWGLTSFARRQPNPWLALLVSVPYLVIVVAMGYTRQAVAIGLILVGLSRIVERESLLRFGLYVLLAAAFHKTAIIVLPLVSFGATKNRLAMVGAGAFMVATLYYLFLYESIDSLMQNYVTAEYDSQGAAVRVAMNLVAAALFLIFRKRFRLPEFERKLWTNFSIAAFGALALLLLIRSSTVVDRLALYLIPLQLFVFSRLPRAFGTPARENRVWILIVIAYSGLVQLIWLTSATNAAFWLPYQVYHP